MKTRQFLSVALLAALTASVVPAMRAAPEAVDLDTLKLQLPENSGERVDINIDSGLIGFMSRVAAKKEPEAAAFLRNIKKVQVRVYKQSGVSSAAALAGIEELRSRLDSQGWQRPVRVREAKGGNVDIHLRMGADEAIEGLVISVVDNKDELVLVNIVGSINPDQLGELAEQLDIKELRELHLGKKHGDKACAPAKDKDCATPSPVAPSGS